MRASTLSKRNCERRCTVVWRNAIHSSSIWRMVLGTGRPSKPTIVKLMDDELSKLVWASKLVMSSCCSMVRVLGSNTKRTGASLLDSSRTPSSTAKMVALSMVCSGLSAFLPVFTLGLVSSSISSSTFWLLTPGGNSLTTNCH